MNLLIPSKNSITTFILGFVLIFKVSGQTDLPELIPPSPETNSLFRIIDFNINHSTGVPAINIPLYEIQSGSLSLPISISYDASGRKVMDPTGPIGVGWVLNAGGVVSRTIYGKPDDESNFAPESMLLESWELNNLPNDQKFQYLSSFYKEVPDQTTYGYNVYDTQYDLFSYSFGEHSGKFFFRNDSSNPTLLPQKSFKITGGVASGFTIKDDKGVSYNFESGFFETFMGSGLSNKKSAWHLGKITSADNKDEILFNYKLIERAYASNIETYTIIDQKHNSYVSEPNFNTSPLKNTTTYYKLSRVTEITFKNGSILFNLDVDTDRVNSIIVKDVNNVVYKTIEFIRSNLDFPTFPGTEYKEKLDRVIIKDRTGAVVETYKFDYFSTNSAGTDAPDSYHIANRDWWGYRNNTSQDHLLPFYNISYAPDGFGGTTNQSFGYGANRTPNALMAQRGVLKSITYPTGGSTEFVFEGNKYFSDGLLRDGPGLRISKIINRNSEGTANEKWYEYGQGELHNWYVSRPPTQHMVHLDMWTPSSRVPGGCVEGGYRIRTISSEFNSEMAFSSNIPVFYSQVTEYIGTNVQNAGKTVFYYDKKNSSESSAFNQINLDVSGCGNFNWGYDSTLPERYVRRYNYWDNPVLKERTVYENTGSFDGNGNLVYNMQRKSQFNYQSVTAESVRGLLVNKFLEFGPSLNSSGMDPEEYAGEEMGLPVYSFADYWIEVGRKELTSVIETDFLENGQVQKTTTYTYNDKFLVSEAATNINNGQEIIVKNRYPFDLNLEAPHQTMIGKNMINFVISKEEYLNNTLLSSSGIKFLDWGNDIIKPQLLSHKKGSAQMEDRVIYSRYDLYGNPVEVAKKDGSTIVYVWGYNKEFPIAKIENATYAEVAGALNNGQGISVAALDAYNETNLGSINSLRGYLPQSSITTYTYDPLIGIKSITDPRGEITTFHYDDFNRLEFVKDEDGNILKEHKYQYKINP